MGGEDVRMEMQELPNGNAAAKQEAALENGTAHQPEEAAKPAEKLKTSSYFRLFGCALIFLLFASRGR